MVIDFDIGLRNLDLIMGCERRVVYDFVNVINGEANLNQALIKDKRCENLFILPASQTRDKDALTVKGEKILDQLAEMQFDYIVCDSPAGIESGALMALYFADEAIVTTNPEVSSVRDSDRILGILASKSRRAERGEDPIKEHLLLTRYCPTRVNRGDMLSVQDVQEILAIKLLGGDPGVPGGAAPPTPASRSFWTRESDAGQAYEDAVARLLGDTKDFRFLEEERASLADCSGVKHVIIGLFSFQQRNRTPHNWPKSGCRSSWLTSVHPGGPDYLPQLKQDILDVIRKYVQIDPDKITVQLDQRVTSCRCWSSTSPSPTTRRRMS